jgi:hypothetical protein
MTLLFMDGFDHYNSVADCLDKGNYAESWLAAVAETGRFEDGKAIRLSSKFGYLRKPLTVSTYSTVYMGAAHYYSAGIPTLSQSLFTFMDEGASNNQVLFYVNSDNSIAAYRGSTSNLLGTSAAGVLPSNGWFYIEARCTISATVGVVVVNINGTEVLNLTGQNTKDSTDYIDGIALGGLDGKSYTYPEAAYWDDFYIDDSQFHGNCHIQTFLPDSDGTYTDFTRSTGSNDYEAVDANPPVDATEYIYSSTDEEKSTFGITTGSLNTVKGIQLNNRLTLDAPGVRTVKPVVRSNSTDYIGGVYPAIGSSPLFYTRVYETDPDDSNPWTQAKLEAAEFGLKIES